MLMFKAWVFRAYARSQTELRFKLSTSNRLMNKVSKTNVKVQVM